MNATTITPDICQQLKCICHSINAPPPPPCAAATHRCSAKNALATLKNCERGKNRTEKSCAGESEVEKITALKWKQTWSTRMDDVDRAHSHSHSHTHKHKHPCMHTNEYLVGIRLLLLLIVGLRGCAALDSFQPFSNDGFSKF